jgi:hypothetical protein
VGFNFVQGRRSFLYPLRAQWSWKLETKEINFETLLVLCGKGPILDKILKG